MSRLHTGADTSSAKHVRRQSCNGKVILSGRRTRYLGHNDWILANGRIMSRLGLVEVWWRFSQCDCWHPPACKVLSFHITDTRFLSMNHISYSLRSIFSRIMGLSEICHSFIVCVFLNPRLNHHQSASQLESSKPYMNNLSGVLLDLPIFFMRFLMSTRLSLCLLLRDSKAEL